MGFRTIKLEISEEDEAKLKEKGALLRFTGYTGSSRYDFIYRLEFEEKK